MLNSALAVSTPCLRELSLLVAGISNLNSFLAIDPGSLASFTTSLELSAFIKPETLYLFSATFSFVSSSVVINFPYVP